MKWLKVNNEWFERYNTPWLQKIISRGDRIKVISEEIPRNLINKDGTPTHFARELDFLRKNGYSPGSDWIDGGVYWYKSK
ncbi:hypothetical protein B0A80_20335 [Flavobacterium tructae]|uniref:hypothetical protein n=1 Tax=Flavobacterium tructae TaxID=1114873 RepID=UPI000B5B7A70|nr:hypothetical protein [Flavobacterium tructae]OXB18939.1 hypothetical protein B0A80_20335 [Flavobacterium tructae]